MVFWLCDWTRRPRDFSARCGGFTRRTPNAVASCSRALAPITPATFRALTTRTEVTAQVDADDRRASVGAGVTGRRGALENRERLKLLYYLRLSTSVQLLQPVRRHVDYPVQMF